MAITAKWKDGTGFFKADANKVAREIAAIGDNVTPEQIVEKAKRKNTELHKCFEWDDKIAAEKWRIQTARLIVCQLVVKDENRDPSKPEVRIFVNNDKKEGYKKLEIVLKNPDEYQKLLETAYEELRRFKAKYSMLTELRDIFDLIK